MTTNGRRLFPSWQSLPFVGMASAVVGKRLLTAWHSMPFPRVALADFFN